MSQPGSTPHVILVHGAWHGAWCWTNVAAELAAAGLAVTSIDLPGCGARAGDMNASIGLQTHIDDLRQRIYDVNSTNVILMGHSYGGMVITGAIDGMADRIAHALYLDAALPEDGQSMISYGAPRSAADIAGTTAFLTSMAPDGIAMAPLPAVAFGIAPDHPQHDWVQQNLRPHPLKTWTDPIKLSSKGGLDIGGDISKTYIHCVRPVLEQTQFPYIAQQVKADPRWNYVELQTGHDAMVTAPQDVAKLLIRAAEGARK
jgi:pimeloyl-ACP methyl ester carboxylesterase